MATRVQRLTRLLSSSAAERATPTRAAEALPRLHAPTQSDFDALLFASHTPFVVTGALDDWPASRWTPASLAQRFGDAVVPIELSAGGADYRHAHHPDPRARARFVAGEEMPLRAFVDTFVTGAAAAAAAASSWRGYLAQHAGLFDSVPELGAEAPPPALLGVAGTRAERRLWLGPAATATPLHRDPYHNLFCQVHGRKRVRLYAASQAESLQPFTAPPVLRNTSRVEVDAAERGLPPAAAAAFPAFAQLPYWSVDLQPGEALAMPAGVWHSVRALDASISVSFWWTT